jgi:hypothetical protein
MNWSRLIFRDKVAVKAEYAEMAAYFKIRARIGENYFKGYIDDHQAQILCDWDFMSVRFFFMPVPICQINFDDKKDADGRTVVHLKMMNSVIIFMFIISVMSCGMVATTVPIVFVLFIPALFYGLLSLKYAHTFSNLMSDLKTIEYRHDIIASQKLR